MVYQCSEKSPHVPWICDELMTDESDEHVRDPHIVKNVKMYLNSSYKNFAGVELIAISHFCEFDKF